MSGTYIKEVKILTGEVWLRSHSLTLGNTHRIQALASGGTGWILNQLNVKVGEITTPRFPGAKVRNVIKRR